MTTEEFEGGNGNGKSPHAFFIMGKLAMLQDQEPTGIAEFQRNPESPVSNVPGDVLLYIFSINSHLDYDHPHYPSLTTRRTAQVCQLWRTLALSFPIIWADSLDFEDPLPWINEVIIRTRDVPIKVIFPSVTTVTISAPRKAIGSVRFHLQRVMAMAQDAFNEAKFAIALSLAERAHTLLLRPSSSQWAHLIRHFQGLSMPHLKKIAVLLGPVSAIVLKHPLDIHTPQLREVYLRGCSSNFSSPFLRNITSLSFQRVEDIDLLTPSTWLRILRGMSYLEYLYLDLSSWPCNVGDLPDQLTPTESDSLSLPNLVYFRIHGHFITCGAIIALLEVPSTCGMHITSYRTQDNETFQMMISTLRRRFDPTKEGLHKSVKTLDLNIGAGGVTFSNRKTENEEDQALYFAFFLPYGSSMSPSMLANFLTVIALLSPGVDDLYFERKFFSYDNSGLHPIIAQTIETLPLTKLEKLLIPEEESLCHFLSAVNGREEMRGPLFPSLQTISLQNMILGTNRLNDHPFQELLKFLEQRKVFGLPVRLIELRDCGGSQGLQFGRVAKLESFANVDISRSAVPESDSDDEAM